MANMISERVGPLPVWGWFAIGGGALWLMGRNKTPKQPAQTTSEDVVPYPTVGPTDSVMVLPSTSVGAVNVNAVGAPLGGDSGSAVAVQHPHTAVDYEADNPVASPSGSAPFSPSHSWADWTRYINPKSGPVPPVSG